MIEKIIIFVIGIFFGMMVSALLQVAGEESDDRYEIDEWKDRSD